MISLCLLSIHVNAAHTLYCPLVDSSLFLLHFLIMTFHSDMLTIYTKACKEKLIICLMILFIKSDYNLSASAEYSLQLNPIIEFVSEQ